MVEVAHVVGSVDNVETGQDDHDQGDDEGDEADDDVDDLHHTGGGQFVSRGEANAALDQVQSTHPVALTQGYLITDIIVT